jgi:hypothetical protein
VLTLIKEKRRKKCVDTWHAPVKFQIKIIKLIIVLLTYLIVENKPRFYAPKKWFRIWLRWPHRIPQSFINWQENHTISSQKDHERDNKKKFFEKKELEKCVLHVRLGGGGHISSNSNQLLGFILWSNSSMYMFSSSVIN